MLDDPGETNLTHPQLRVHHINDYHTESSSFHSNFSTKLANNFIENHQEEFYVA